MSGLSGKMSGDEVGFGGHDLLDRSRLIGNLVNHVRKVKHGVVFETAGGDAPANEETEVHLPGLPGGAKALIMDSSP